MSTKSSADALHAQISILVAGIPWIRRRPRVGDVNEINHVIETRIIQQQGLGGLQENQSVIEPRKVAHLSPAVRRNRLKEFYTKYYIKLPLLSRNRQIKFVLNSFFQQNINIRKV
jgi:hypothetical protein